MEFFFKHKKKNHRWKQTQVNILIRRLRTMQYLVCLLFSNSSAQVTFLLLFRLSYLFSNN